MASSTDDYIIPHDFIDFSGLWPTLVIYKKTIQTLSPFD